MTDRSYEGDSLAWAEYQAGLLRRLAAGERLNEPVDWPNVIEEVQDVGLSELRACRNLLRQAIIHLLKLHAWPASRSTGHWQAETLNFIVEARDAFSPSMRQRIDLGPVYAMAMRQAVTAGDESGAPREPRRDCPYSIADLLADDPDLAVLVAKLAP